MNSTLVSLSDRKNRPIYINIDCIESVTINTDPFLTSSLIVTMRSGKEIGISEEGGLRLANILDKLERENGNIE